MPSETIRQHQRLGRIVGALAGLVIIVLAAWMFGSGLARLSGGLLIIIGLLRVASDHASPRMWTFVAAGAGLWLFGHWLWAFKHKLWRTRIALSLFSLPLLDGLAPIPTNRVRRDRGASKKAGQWVQQ